MINLIFIGPVNRAFRLCHTLAKISSMIQLHRMRPHDRQTENIVTLKFWTGRPPETSFLWRLSTVSVSAKQDWTRPQALAIPKEGYFQLEKGKYGPVFPRTPACYGFTIIAKIKPGREQVIREHGKKLEK